MLYVNFQIRFLWTQTPLVFHHHKTFLHVTNVSQADMCYVDISEDSTESSVHIYYSKTGERGGAVVETLRYKP
jgi:hypothetical protein